jgi:hypothetical protein
MASVVSAVPPNYVSDSKAARRWNRPGLTEGKLYYTCYFEFHLFLTLPMIISTQHNEKSKCKLSEWLYSAVKQASDLTCYTE